MALSAVAMEPHVHETLKTQARKKGVKLKEYMHLMVQFFHLTGLDPEDYQRVGTGAGGNDIKSLRKQTDYIVRFLKTMEDKEIKPMAEQIFAIALSMDLIQPGTPSRKEIPLEGEVTCPKCQHVWEDFDLGAAEVSCKSCDLEIKTRIGDIVLTPADLAALLSGGISRFFPSIKTLGGAEVSGRAWLHPDDFALCIYECEDDHAYQNRILGKG